MVSIFLYDKNIMNCKITDSHTKAILSLMPVESMKVFYTFLDGKGTFSRSKFPAFALSAIKKELSTLVSCPIKSRVATSYIRQLKQGQQFGGMPPRAQGTQRTQGAQGTQGTQGAQRTEAPKPTLIDKSIRVIAVIVLLILLFQIYSLYWDRKHIIEYTSSVAKCHTSLIQSYETESTLNFNNIIKQLSSFLPGADARVAERQLELTRKQELCQSEALLARDITNSARLYEIKMYFTYAAVAVMIAGGRAVRDSVRQLVIPGAVSTTDLLGLAASTSRLDPVGLVRDVYNDEMVVSGARNVMSVTGAATGLVRSAAKGAVKGASGAVAGVFAKSAKVTTITGETSVAPQTVLTRQPLTAVQQKPAAKPEKKKRETQQLELL